MQKNPHVNWAGYMVFIGTMIFSVVFIIFTTVFQPGPVDAQALPDAGLTKEDYVNRIKAWSKSSPESVARGEKSYKLNCAFFYEEGGSDPFLEMFKSGNLPNRGTEIDVFRMISKGDIENGIMKLDHLQTSERWDIVHYLRSLNPNLPSASNSDWKQFYNEGA